MNLPTRALVIGAIALLVVAASGTWTPLEFQRLVDNRDLMFSVAAGAFSIWSYVAQRHSAQADAARLAFQNAYGTMLQIALSRLRELFADLDTLCNRDVPAFEIIENVRRDLYVRLDRQLRDIHGCYRELLHRSPESVLVDRALQTALEAEDQLKEALSDLILAYENHDLAVRAAARTACGGRSRFYISKMQDHLHDVSSNPPARTNHS